MSNSRLLSRLLRAQVTVILLQVSKGACNYANQTLLDMAQGAVEYAKELWLQHPEMFFTSTMVIASRALQELCRHGLFCHDRRFCSSLWGEYRLDQEGRRLCSSVWCNRRRWTWCPRRCWGWGRWGFSLYKKPEEVIDFSTKFRCWLIGYFYRYKPRCYKFKPEQCTRDPKTGRLVPPPLAFDVLDAWWKTSWFPNRTSRIFFCSTGICWHDQPVWWQTARCSRYPRGAAPQSS